MVRINRITKSLPDVEVLAKIETFNPGNSIKDRMAIRMIEDAERSGRLKPGGTIVEGTSGNTGMGLAIAAVVKGYHCIFTTTDKQSKEKVDALKAFGADVIVCPTNVDPEDPRSYYSVRDRLATEILPAPGVSASELAEAAQLASLADETPEGRSIVVLLKDRYGLRGREMAPPGEPFLQTPLVIAMPKPMAGGGAASIL